MAYNIKKIPCTKMVVVIGAGHIKGITENLKKNISPNTIKDILKIK